MAFVTGTTWTHATAGSMTYGTNQREDVEDVLWELDPMDTWALSNFDKVSATGTLHEWLSDTLAAAAANIVEEGDDASYATATPAPRYGNYQQIIRKTFIVSDTLEQVKKIGRDTETGRGCSHDQFGPHHAVTGDGWRSWHCDHGRRHHGRLHGRHAAHGPCRCVGGRR
jgi:hypothetical protein